MDEKGDFSSSAKVDYLRKKKTSLCYKYLQPVRWILCRETNKSQSRQASLMPNLFNIFCPDPLRNCSAVHSAQSKWIRYNCSPGLNTKIWDWLQEWRGPQEVTHIPGLDKAFPSSLPCHSLLIQVCIMPYLSIHPKTYSEKSHAWFVRKPETILSSCDWMRLEFVSDLIQTSVNQE